MEKGKMQILSKIHTSMNNGIRAGKSKLARNWMEQHGLSIDTTFACFNSGQMHHRKEESFIKELKSVGFLTECGVNGKKENKPPAYTSFGKEAIVFPLKNAAGDTVNFYSIRINVSDSTNEYLNKEGIYPSYPSPKTTKLYITNTILDAASLLESELLENRDSVIALNDGELTQVHINAIEQLTQLKEIIIIH